MSQMYIFVLLLALCAAFFIYVTIRSRQTILPLLGAEIVTFVAFNPGDGGALFRGLASQFVIFDCAVIVMCRVVCGPFSRGARCMPTWIRALIVGVPFLAVLGRTIISNWT